MIFKSLEISDVVLVTPRKFADDRGYFMETFRQNTLSEFVGRDIKFVQDNQSFSIHTSTVRGLHFQSPPFAQGKLVRCTQGSIIDVAVDVRKSSRTYGKSVSAVLSQQNCDQLWMPEGFIHGFITLEPNTEVQYKCTNYYDSNSDGNVIWNDPTIAIDWGIDEKDAFLSDKDKAAPNFESFNSPFS